jgi:phosphoglycolate phosphatase
MTKRIKGIVFDMDNTLLGSKIDFAAMRDETFDYIISSGLAADRSELDGKTTAAVIERVAAEKKISNEMLMRIWDIPKKHEVLGTLNAPLEPGVMEILKELHGKYKLTVLTNNSIEACDKAFKSHDIFEFFDLIVAREMVGSLKPSPDGFRYILDYYGEIKVEEWISVGDSWLDGKASDAVGMKFIAYKPDMDRMKDMGVKPFDHINDIRDIKRFL